MTQAQHAAPPSAALKRAITLPQAIGVSFHQIVGGGVIALMGVAISFTGSGTPIAFLIAAAAVMVYSLPLAALGSAMPVTGGRYAYAARLISPSAGFVTMWFSLAVTLQLSLMALAGAQYLHAWIDAIPVRPIAIAIMTVFLLANLRGASFSSRLGVWLMWIMLVAFGAYIVVGLPQVNWTTAGEIMPHGAGGLLTAAAFLTFAVTGSSYVAEIGGEMKRPGRDIPVSMIGGIVIATVLYVLMALPSVGVLPIDQVAGKPLTVVANHLFNAPLMAFFVLGGAMVSVIGHINSLLLTATKPILAAIEDGWFPRRLGAVNERYGTPHWLLVGLYIIGVVPIVFDFSLESIAGMVAVAATPMLAIIIIASLRLRRHAPELEARAPFRLPRWLHVTVVVLGVAALALQAYLLSQKLTAASLWALIAWAAIGAGVLVVRRRKIGAPALIPMPAKSTLKATSEESTGAVQGANGR
jgi:APA family basic amino acid/polyamine antiporter